MADYSSMMCLVVLVLCSVVSFMTVSSQEDLVQKDVTAKQWAEKVSSNQRFLVVFHKAKGCPSCKKMVGIVSNMAGDPDIDGDLQMGLSTDTALAGELGVSEYPGLVFLRENSHVLYDGKAVVDDVAEWILMAKTKAIQHLNDDSFEHLTQASSGATTGDWLVAFYQDRCPSILPVIESVGVRIRQKTNVAVVDTSKNNILAERFSIKACPEIILFKQGKMYRYDIPKVDQASLRSFVDAWYRNSKAENVLPQKSKFDFLTESIADYIKTQLKGENKLFAISALCGAVVSFVLIAFCCCRSVMGSNKKVKSE